MSFAPWLVKQLIMASQFTYFRGRGGYSPEALMGRGEFPQSRTEQSRAEDFFRFFDHDVKAEIAGRDVLDFGSGYGGRTVEYARMARFVWGVEPVERHISISTAFARQCGVGNVEFRLCSQERIPLPDASVDAVLSYDVLEHVEDPRVSVAEIHRVLRPGGMAFLVFPPYLGAFSHHLNYVTLLPGLHWLFSPRTLIDAVNSILVRYPDRFGTLAQPMPGPSFDGAREVLPALNGLGSSHLPELFAGFECQSIGRRGYLRRIGPPTRAMRSLQWLPAPLLDAFTHSLSCILRKPA